MIYERDGKIIPKDEKQVKGPPPESFKIWKRSTAMPMTWWAPETRLEDMDRQGWDVQVLLPTGNTATAVARYPSRTRNLARPIAGPITQLGT